MLAQSHTGNEADLFAAETLAVLSEILVVSMLI
jgi:hypothetical protein